jgi:hypothetical protein
MKDPYRRRTNTKKYIIISLSILAGIVLLILGYSVIRRLKDPITPAINAIPANAVCLIKINSPQGFYEHLNPGNMLWKELQCLQFFDQLQQQIHDADSMTSSDKYITLDLTKNPLYIAWIPFRGTYKPLYTINLPGPHDERAVDNFIRKHIKPGSSMSASDFLTNRIYSINYPGKPSFCYTVYQGIFIASGTTGLIESSLSTLITGVSIENTENYSKLVSMSGKKVDANIFIDLAYFDNLFQFLFLKNTLNDLKYLSLTADMAELDLTVKKDELLLNGYAVSNDTLQLFKKVFQKQKPQQITLTNVCPANTAIMFYWGLSNIPKYIEDYADFMKTNFHRRPYNDICSYYDTVYNTSVKEKIFDGLKEEISFVITENPNTENRYRSYALFKTKDVNEFLANIAELSSSTGEKTTEQPDSFAIKKFKPQRFFRNFFGNLFASLDSAYYTSIGDVVIFGDSPTSLDLFISGYLSGKTLDKNENYKNFSNNVSSEANFCFYTNIRKSFGLVNSIFASDMARSLMSKESNLRNFQALAFQFASGGNKFYLNGYLMHNAFYIEENPSIWEFQADTTISGKANIITDPKDNSQKLVFFDKSGNMYLLNHNGELIWKKHVDEVPISKVYVVETSNQNKTFLVFNSRNAIYISSLYDQNSKPNQIKLPYAATSGISIIDYDNNQNYRILTPSLNQRIYNYSLNGKATPGWNSISTLAVLIKPLEYVKFAKKEYLIATDKNGHVYIIDRRGFEVFRSKKPFLQAKNSRFYVYKDGNKQYLLTSDRSGQLIFISANGTVDVVKLNTFSNDHYFLYGDFNNDGNDDFIFFDRGKIFVYNHNKKKIFESFNKNEPGGQPTYLRVSATKFYMIYPNKACTRLVMMNNLGFMETDAYTIGNPEIEINSLLNKNVNSIIVSDSSRLLNYIIE